MQENEPKSKWWTGHPEKCAKTHNDLSGLDNEQSTQVS